MSKVYSNIRLFSQTICRAAACLAVALFIFTAAASAATYTVDTTADDGSLNACTTSPGDCSLRGAINNANSDGVDSAITFAVSGTIRLTSRLPALANNGTLSITGPQAGITISGDANNTGVNDAGDVPIFSMTDGAANVTLDKLDLRGGRDTLDKGGAITNFGTLRVSNCTLALNVTDYGGAIYNVGTLTVTGSTLADNTANLDGGAIFNRGMLTVTGSTLERNYAARDGGAIINAIVNISTLTMTGSTLAGNNAGDNGGAIRNNGAATIINCTLHSNYAVYNGGAIFNFRTLTMTNSTLASNSASNDGGAIYNQNVVTWKNNLFADNSSLGAFGNLNDPTSSGDANKNYSFDTLGAAGLSNAANNGGPTQTMALSPSSPVVDKGLDTTLAPDSLSTDQRGTGYARKSGSAVDIGAFEVQLAPTAATVSVSGRVTAKGRGISNAVVHLTSQSGEILTARTNRLGYYTVTELAAGETYIFNVFSKRYQFVPKVINLTEDLSEIDFTAQ